MTYDELMKNIKFFNRNRNIDRDRVSVNDEIFVYLAEQLGLMFEILQNTQKKLDVVDEECNPRYKVHPGENLKKIMENMKISIPDFAKKSLLSEEMIKDMLNHKLLPPIGECALLGAATGTCHTFWWKNSKVFAKINNSPQLSPQRQ